MAEDTPLSYRNLVIYEVYVRNHGPHDTFADVEADLPRIRSMGVDVVWLMPIHPIGQVHRKGQLGCPYSIADYREVNPEYGSKTDLVRLIEKAHALGLRVMIDIVYNHTAHDSRLVREHPEWFHQDEQGRPVTTVPEWSDVVDLKHPNEGLTAYLIETLQMWARFGVDGFRCDVASLVPQDFWIQARREVARVKPGVIWLAESVHASFVEARRFAGLTAFSDGELYRAFDLTYDYDIWPIWQAAVRGKVPIVRYLEILRLQDCIYPANYVKMRCVENHDQLRILALAPSRAQALAWTAFQAFNKGAFLLYAGQESAAEHTPSLFDVDKIEWGDHELQPFLTTLAKLKKDPAQTSGQFVLLADEPIIQAVWYLPGSSLYGLFNTQACEGQVAVPLADGMYTDLLNGAPVQVRQGQATLRGPLAILRYTGELQPKPLYSDLLDYHEDVQ
ncbi:MAG: alpha-amylase [Chloroflexi bacterium]|nr:alpha-amylase [Chloroflexota bacterium]